MALLVRVSPTDITPGTNGSYVDTDVSSYVPSGAAGVVIRVVSTANQSWDIRKNGSTTARYYLMGGSYHVLSYCGIDANRVLEIKVQNKTYVKFYLVGYFSDDVTMFTNPTDLAPSGTGTYYDKDLSASCPDGVVVFLSPYGGGFYTTRMNGSTDDALYLKSWIGAQNASRSRIVGLDANQVFEWKQSVNRTYAYLEGFSASGDVTMHTNMVDRSIGTTGSWTDLTAANSGALVAFYAVKSETAYYSGGIRKDGTADDPYADFYPPVVQGWVVECGTNGVVEGKIENAVVDFWELGYQTGNTAPTAPTGLLCEGASNPTSVTDLTPEFRAQYNDPDSGDIANKIEVHVGKSNVQATLESSPDMWDSGEISISNVSEGDVCEDVSYAGTALSQDGLQLYWICRFKDDDAEWGAWSAVANFRMNLPSEKTIEDAIPMDDALSRAAERAAADTIGLADAFAREGQHGETDTITLSDGDHVRREVLISDGLPMADGVKRDAEHAVFTDEISVDDALAGRVAEKTLADQVTLVDASQRTAEKTLADSMTLADEAGREGVRSIGDSLSMSDGDFVSATKSLADGMAMAVALSREAVRETFSDAMSLDDVVTREATKKTFEDEIGLADGFSKQGTKSLADAISMQEIVNVWSPSMPHSSTIELHDLLNALSLERLIGRLDLHELDTELGTEGV